MKLATVQVAGIDRVVAGVGDWLVDLERLSRRYGLGPAGFPRDMVELLDAGELRDYFLGRAAEVAARETEVPGYGVSEVTWRAPILRPPKLVCIFANKPDIGIERLDPSRGGKWPRPLFFMKAPTSVVGNGEPIEVIEGMGVVQPEAELGLVIGKRARRVPRERVWDHIFGYTMLNDVTAASLSWQDAVELTIYTDDPNRPERFPLRPMGRYKGVDTFGPLGPWIVTRNEVSDLDNMVLRTRLNGKVVQEGLVRDYRYSVEDCIEAITAWVTLEPGDVVSMGTTKQAEGWPLRAPDLSTNGGVIEVEGTGIGTLSNPIQILKAAGEGA